MLILWIFGIIYWFEIPFVDINLQTIDIDNISSFKIKNIYNIISLKDFGVRTSVDYNLHEFRIYDNKFLYNYLLKVEDLDQVFWYKTHQSQNDYVLQELNKLLPEMSTKHKVKINEYIMKLDFLNTVDKFQRKFNLNFPISSYRACLSHWDPTWAYVNSYDLSSDEEFFNLDLSSFNLSYKEIYAWDFEIGSEYLSYLDLSSSYDTSTEFNISNKLRYNKNDTYWDYMTSENSEVIYVHKISSSLDVDVFSFYDTSTKFNASYKLQYNSTDTSLD